MGRSLMSSILFKPIIFTPFRSMEAYREDVFWIGSPMVFHTAPPQPASNARITWSPVFVGGPEASQNGLGDSTPHNFTRRSAIHHLAVVSFAGATSFRPRQINHPTTASMPIQPLKRTLPAI